MATLTGQLRHVLRRRAAFVLAGLVVLGVLIWLVNRPSAMAAGVEECDPRPVLFLESEDSLTFLGVKGDGNAYDMYCVLKRIGTPVWLQQEIDSTTALMGGQAEESNGYLYRWSFHPDDGLMLVVAKK